MARGSRHWLLASPVTLSAPRAPRAPRYLASSGHPAGIRWPRVSRVVHSLFRVTPPPERQEWPKLRAVADQRDSSPVGEPVAAPPLVALQRESRLPNQPPRD